MGVDYDLMITFDAKKAWSGLAIYVLLADYALIKKQKTTMSGQYADWLNSPLGRFWTFVIMCYLVTHLEGRPRVFRLVDPLHLIADRLRKVEQVMEEFIDVDTDD